MAVGKQCLRIHSHSEIHCLESLSRFIEVHLMAVERHEYRLFNFVLACYAIMDTDKVHLSVSQN